MGPDRRPGDPVGQRMAAVIDPLAPRPPAREPPGPGRGGPVGRADPTGTVARPAGGPPTPDQAPVGRLRKNPEPSPTPTSPRSRTSVRAAVHPAPSSPSRRQRARSEGRLRPVC
jgi:hypothetical protein